MCWCGNNCERDVYYDPDELTEAEVDVVRTLISFAIDRNRDQGITVSLLDKLGLQDKWYYNHYVEKEKNDQ